MHVRMKAEITAPAVETHQQTWSRPEVFGVGEKCHQGSLSATEQQVHEAGAVVKPQWNELMRYSEDAMVMRAFQKLCLAGSQPALPQQSVAERATTMLAGIEMHLDDMPVWASLYMTAKCG